MVELNDIDPDADPRQVITNYMEGLAQIDAETHIYHEFGEFRDGAVPTPTEDAALQKVRDLYDCVPNQCYHNAVKVVIGRDNLSYVEGFVVDEESPIPIKHGWVETADGTIWELTFPEDRIEGCVYFGVEYPTADVTEAALAHEAVYPMAAFENGNRTPEGETLRESFTPVRLDS